MMQLTIPGAEPPASVVMLRRLFEMFDEADIPYCVLHGYEDFAHRVSSDVDCMFPAGFLPQRLAALLNEHSASAHANEFQIVQWLQDDAHFVVLANGGSTRLQKGGQAHFAPKTPQNEPAPDGFAREFVQLHAHASYDLAKRVLYSADEILAGRRRYRNFWIPAARIEFTCFLARKIAKGQLDSEDAARLSRLYEEDRKGIVRELSKWWQRGDLQLIVSAADSGDWSVLEKSSAVLRRELYRRATWNFPLRLAGNVGRAAERRLSRLVAPGRGLNVVLLGTDGSGKSSVLQAIRQDLAPAFARSVRRTFPPALLNRGGSVTNSTPHAAKPRSVLNSVIRALGYWLTYYTLGDFLTTRPALAQNQLILHDRHLIDALVDAKRCRYGGPRWLLQLICWLVPKPDLVILLDAPAEVAQSRKQEVSLTETRRQRAAYRSLVETMPNGHIVDSARPLVQVTSDVNAILLQYLAARAAKQVRREVDR